MVPVGAFLTVKAVCVDAGDTIRLSKHRFVVHIDNVVQECQHVGKSGTKHQWRLNSPLRLFQTRMLYIDVYSGGVSRLIKQEPVNSFTFSFADLMKQKPNDPGLKLWQFTRYDYVGKYDAQIEMHFYVSLDYFWLSRLDFAKAPNVHQIMQPFAGLSMDKFELGIDSVTKVLYGFRIAQQKLSDANIDLGSLVDRLRDIAKDVQPIAALVMTVISIPFKMWMNLDKYRKQASDLCKQVWQVTGYLGSLTIVSEPSQPLIDALVAVIEGLLDASAVLMEFRQKNWAKRVMHAQYDKTCENLTQVLKRHQEQLHDSITIDIRIELERVREMGELRSYLKPVTSQPTEHICHSQTRLDILEKIYTWVRDPDVDQKTLRIGGMPGIGKTAIASTVYAWCSEQGLQPAKFFFKKLSSAGRSQQSGDQECSNPALVWPTLAWQLAEMYPSIRRTLFQAIDKKGALSADVCSQFNDLIVPCLVNNASLFERTPCVVIIDALDEGMQADQRTWLSFLQTLRSWPGLLAQVNYRLIVLGRDLQAIQDYLTTDVCVLCPPTSDDDVRRILSAEIGPESDCEPPLSQSEIDHLVGRAGGLPIWAKTTASFVRKGRGIVRTRLSAVLFSANVDSANPIYQLYEDVITTAFSLLQPEEKKAVQLFLAITLVSGGVLPLDYVMKCGDQTLAVLDERLIGDLSPILQVSGKIYTFAHLSVIEFLDDRDRQARLGIPVAKAYSLVALLTLESYTNALKRYGKRLDDVLTLQRSARPPPYAQSPGEASYEPHRRPEVSEDDKAIQNNFRASLAGLKVHLMNAIASEERETASAKMSELVMDEAALFLRAKNPNFLLRWEIEEIEEYVGSLRETVRHLDELARLVRRHV